MNIDFLKYYVTTIEKGNITKAADDLFISRQALSKAIHRAEKELGVTLLIFENQHIKLTNAGSILYNEAKNIINSYDEMINSIENIKDKVTLNIGYARMIQYFLTDQQIDSFEKKYPNIKIKHSILPQDPLIKKLNNNELDAIITDSNYQNDNYKFQTIIKRASYALVAEDDILANKTSISINDLTNRNIIFQPTNKNDAHSFETLANKHHINTNIIYASDPSITTIFKEIPEQKAIYLTSALFDDLISPKNCILIPFNNEDNIYNMDIKIFYHKKSDKTNEITKYIKSIKNS